MRIKGELPLVSLNISDVRLQEIISLGTSIPLPESDEPEPVVGGVPEVRYHV